MSCRHGAVALVRRSNSADSPFQVVLLPSEAAQGHGTKITCRTVRSINTADNEIRETLGTRFLVDPGFEVTINGVPVTLTDISHMIHTKSVEVEGMGVFRIHLLDAREGDRTMRHHGIAYWVNRRLVGDWSWDALVRAGRLLDGRSTEAKRYTFIVEADPLENDVLPDWTGFSDTPRVSEARAVVEEHIAAELRELLKETRQDKKSRILKGSSQVLKTVPSASREYVRSLVDEMVDRCPTINDRDLANLVEVTANLERARSGYTLLEQLARVQPEDLDKLSEVLSSWSIVDAKHVLDELRWRLELISKMSGLINDPKADELHELQPLFQTGLWIFGPEYESREFTSNRTITQVIMQFFRSRTLAPSSRRPDFVVVPESSIGVYDRPRYDEASGQELGPDKLVIVELKRGGFVITDKEMDQARDYAKLIRQSGRVLRDTFIEAFVLGASLDDYIGTRKEGDFTLIRPMAYDWVLRRAHSRTFNLLGKLESLSPRTEDLEQQELDLDSVH